MNFTTSPAIVNTRLATFAGRVCPWDRTAVRSLVCILTEGLEATGDEPDLLELDDLTNTTLSADWGRVSDRILSLVEDCVDYFGTKPAREIERRLRVHLATDDANADCERASANLDSLIESLDRVAKEG